MHTSSRPVVGQLDLLGSRQSSAFGAELAALPTGDSQDSGTARAKFGAELAWSWQFSDAFIDVLESEPVLLAGGPLDQVRASLQQASIESDLHHAASLG